MESKDKTSNNLLEEKNNNNYEDINVKLGDDVTPDFSIEFLNKMDELTKKRNEIMKKMSESNVGEIPDYASDANSQKSEPVKLEHNFKSFEEITHKSEQNSKENIEKFANDYSEEKSAKTKNNKKNKEKDEKAYKNTYIYGFIFIIFAILFEMVNFLRLGLGMFPAGFGIELAMIIIVAGIIFIVPTEPAKIIIASILLGVQMIMNIANASLYNMMYDIITVDMIFTLGFETMDAFELNQLDLIALISNLILTALYVVSIALGSKYMPKYKIRKDKRAIVALITLLFTIEMIGVGSLRVSQMAYFSKADAEYIMDDGDYLYTTMSAKMASLKKYGFWCFYLNNCDVFFNYQKNISQEQLNALKEYVEAGDGFRYEGSMHGAQNVSGTLAGDNLVMVMMESIEWFAIDPFNTPSLYSFVHNDALSFNNYYSRNKTNISEEISLLGSIVNDYSFTTISSNVGLSASHSLPSLFKDNGYESVNFFHDYTGKMYDRDTLNVEIGFDHVYAMEECPIEDKPQYFGDFWDDGDFAEVYANTMMPTDKSFFSFFTTVTTHGPYENHNKRLDKYGYYEKFDNNYQDYCNYVRQNNLNFATPEIGTHDYNILKDFKAKAMAVDHAINVICSYLKTHYTNDDETNGTLLWDNTSIVIFADHNAYYSNLCYMVKGTNKYANDKENYRVPLAIYNSKLGSGDVDTFCNTYDLLPTICDLYGFEYNKNLTHGYSVFSDEIENSLFVSTMVGMFDKNYFTVTFDDYTAVDKSLETNNKLSKFKANLNKFLTTQELIEVYYRINYEQYVK